MLTYIRLTCKYVAGYCTKHVKIYICLYDTFAYAMVIHLAITTEKHK